MSVMGTEIATQNLMSVNIKEFTGLIEEQIEFGDTRPILGLGKSGVGKTESISGLCARKKIGYRELRLVTMTETDILGIPRINEYNRTSWASNDLLPNEKRDGTVGILVLDEITSAQDGVRTSAFQLLDSSRRLGDYKLMDGWLVVALGNGPDDGGTFRGLEHAFLSRCRSYRIEPDLRTWLKYASEAGVNPSVISYLKANPEDIYDMNRDAEYPELFPCPRTWKGLSDSINKLEQKYGFGNVPDYRIRLYAGGNIGLKGGEKFGAFYRYVKQSISIDDILGGKADRLQGRKNREIMHITIQSLVKALAKRLSEEEVNDDGMPKNRLVFDYLGNACEWVASSDEIETVVSFSESLYWASEEYKKIYNGSYFEASNKATKYHDMLLNDAGSALIYDDE